LIFGLTFSIRRNNSSLACAIELLDAGVITSTFSLSIKYTLPVLRLTA